MPALCLVLQVSGWEAHDCVRGASIFGNAVLRNAVINLNSGNTWDGFPNNSRCAWWRDLVLHPRPVDLRFPLHALTACQWPARLRARRYWTGAVSGFQWYDVSVMTILSNVQFRNIPYWPSMGVNRPGAILSMIHSDEVCAADGPPFSSRPRKLPHVAPGSSHTLRHAFAWCGRSTCVQFKPSHISTARNISFANVDPNAIIQHGTTNTGSYRYFNFLGACPLVSPAAHRAHRALHTGFQGRSPRVLCSAALCRLGRQPDAARAAHPGGERPHLVAVGQRVRLQGRVEHVAVRLAALAHGGPAGHAHRRLHGPGVAGRGHPPTRGRLPRGLGGAVWVLRHKRAQHHHHPQRGEGAKTRAG